jgi:hypothetical protein
VLTGAQLAHSEKNDPPASRGDAAEAKPPDAY